MEILEGAIFIADAHYPTHGDELLYLLKQIQAGAISTPQIFLMGDVFDLLVAELPSSHEPNQKAINLINLISKNIKIIYLEGNHDFSLAKIFPNIKTYPLSDQPQYMSLSGQRVGISHGDKYGAGWRHSLFSKIVRTSLILKAINKLYPKLVKQKNIDLKSKNICPKITDFEDKAMEILGCYKDIDMVIEGHYHQGVQVGKYISLPSLACQKNIAVARGQKIVFESIKTSKNSPK